MDCFRSVEIHRAFSNSARGQLAFLYILNIMIIGQITRLANVLRKRGIKAKLTSIGTAAGTISGDITMLEQNIRASLNELQDMLNSDGEKGIERNKTLGRPPKNPRKH